MPSTGWSQHGRSKASCKGDTQLSPTHPNHPLLVLRYHALPWKWKGAGPLIWWMLDDAENYPITLQEKKCIVWKPREQHLRNSKNDNVNCSIITNSQCHSSFYKLYLAEALIPLFAIICMHHPDLRTICFTQNYYLSSSACSVFQEDKNPLQILNLWILGNLTEGDVKKQTIGKGI